MCYTTSTLLTLLILLRLPAAAAAAGAPLRLWPGPAPNETRQIGAESRVQDGDQRGCGAARDAPCDRIENVSVPTLTPYLVDQSTTGVGTGTAVIIAPGGGYSILAISKEGEDVARMYNALGVSAFVLKYRVPARADRLGLPHWWAPLQDAQRAVSTVKYYAQKGKWDGKINASRVGFAGFSAGGHLAARVSSYWSRGRAYAPVDGADRASCRPDFAVLGYPWMLLPENRAPAFGQGVARLADEFTDEKGGVAPNARHPPSMFVHNVDDRTAPVAGSTVYHAKLQSVGAPASTLFLSPKGGHGFGLCQNGFPEYEEVCDWPKVAQRFLQSHGLAPGLPATTREGNPEIRDMLTQGCSARARRPPISAATAATTTAKTAAAAAAGFRKLAQGLGIYVGAATPLSLLRLQQQPQTSIQSSHQPPPAPSARTMYTSTLANNFNLATAENECKWGATERAGRGKFDFTQCDGVLNFTKQHNMTLRGHNLCWGKYNPSWLTQLDEEGARQALIDHITATVRHYGTQIPMWDVVNEAIADTREDDHFFDDQDRENAAFSRRPEALDESANPFGFKQSDWYPKVKDFVWVAFRAAREASPPGTRLFYNDYSINSASYAKSQRVYALVKNLTQEGLIDGVGLQFHINTGWEQRRDDPAKGLARSFQQYAALNLTVHVTELDVKNGAQQGGRNDTAQADTYTSVLSACLSAPNCRNFEMWGFEDGHTWLGQGTNPLPFDAQFARKKAGDAIAKMLESWPRPRAGGE